jgi:hydrogenase maturation protein HypF
VKRYHIHIRGRVQGVGFRPFIYREACKKGLKGWVSNTSNGVHIEITVPGSVELEEFCQSIQRHCPGQARIESLEYHEYPFHESNDFSIQPSEGPGLTDLSLTPDFAICKSCSEELFDSASNRYQYPFITCTNCGPRFSIIQQVPYDRPFTTMEHFRMCPSCLEEYLDPDDRRFYSQTNSCPDCPVELTLTGSEREIMPDDQPEILNAAAQAIRESKIVAVKGIGGYLLMADATSALAVQTLRERKRRPTKPFAVMYPDVEMAENDVYSHPLIRSQWESPESPIVLCPFKKNPESGIRTDLIAPGLNRLGILMPYAPLFLLLMDKIRGPVIATSANITESPILHEDQEAIESLSGIADLVLTHNRKIVVPQDDSVVQYAEDSRQKIVLRRARGLAPAFSLFKQAPGSNESLLSLGAMLKSSFGIFHRDRIFISQYLGDTGNLDSQENYEKVLAHLSQVLDFQPDRILVDLHPDYPSTILGHLKARELNIPIVSVQHHEAHACSVLGENDLLDQQDILCVIWDGTGYGHDGQIWGGEFFLYRDYAFSRLSHWPYFTNLGNDRMSIETRLPLLSLLSGEADVADKVRQKFSEVELNNFMKIIRKNKLKTTSTGRIFDAVASLLDISDRNAYEGEAALYLEAEASEIFRKQRDFNKSYEPGFTAEKIPDIYGLVKKIHQDYIKGNISRGEIALKFHLTLVRFIERIAREHELTRLAFSGGVFQNALLVDLIHRELGDSYSLFFHHDLSPNDENVAHGQLMSHNISLKRKENLNDMNYQDPVQRIHNY